MKKINLYKIPKIKNRLKLVTISGVLILTMGLGLERCDDISFQNQWTIENINRNNLSHKDTISQVAKHNDSIDKLHEDIFINLELIIKDNPFIDKNSFYYRLKNLKIKYGNPITDYGKGFDGYYNSEGNTIKYNKNQNNVQPLVVSHESIHALTDLNNMPGFFIEGTTEIMNLEYFHNDITNSSMNDNIPAVSVVKSLSELVGSDVIKKALGKDDPRIIISAMADIIKDDQRAYDDFMRICPYDYDNSKWSDYKLPDTIASVLKPYFEIKYGENWETQIPELEVYEHNFLNGQLKPWPEKYYFNTSKNNKKIKK